MRAALLVLAVLLIAAPTASAAGGWRTAVLARGVPDDEVAVATNARGVTAVAWSDGALGVHVRIAGPSLRFGPVLSVPDAGADITPSDLQVAVGPRGEVVAAWTAFDDAGDDFGYCCTYARAAMRPAGGARFGPAATITPEDDTIETLRTAVTGNGRGVVAWGGYAGVGARTTAPGGTTFGPPRTVRRVPIDGGSARIEAIDGRSSRPRFVYTLGHNSERLIWRGRTLARGAALNALSVGLDARGPAVAAWQDPRENTILKTRGSRAWRRQFVPGHDFSEVEKVPLAVARSGAALVTTKSPHYVYVRRRSPGGVFGRALRVPGADTYPLPTLAIGAGGHGVVAYPSGYRRNRMAAALVGRDGRVGRRALLGLRRGVEERYPSSCSEKACSAATVTPAGRALVAWTDAGRLLVARR